ncbi:hypothetical protein BDZ97DRAFT_2000841 [Flammula alnicola]|nr:hypothetical protein BDZ97DRAFT_2000841 [Flammula alnicola]
MHDETNFAERLATGTRGPAYNKVEEEPRFLNTATTVTTSNLEAQGRNNERKPSPNKVRMFSQSRNFIVSGGTFTQVEHRDTAFERLQKAAAPGAFHNSGDRFDPPKCHPNTRLAVLETIMNWILQLGSEDCHALIMWLYGAAGAGKSAIAQTIAERCYAAKVLLASFFFSRSDPNRNHARSLIPTIAYQIACAIPEARTHLEGIIERDPLVFTRSLKAQMISLIIEPLQPLTASGYFSDPASSPRLIVIDGLDECQDPRVQSHVLEVISDALRQYHIPLIFLVASRPEQDISFTFGSEKLSQFLTRLALDNTFRRDDDIQLFLEESFNEIKATHPRRALIPPLWPSSGTIDILVRKASGQFIYAATVIKFTSSIRHRPTDRLEIILGLRPARHDLPFAELDALYMHIFSSLEEPESSLLIIGFLLLAKNDVPFMTRDMHTITNLEKFLGLNPGDVEIFLGDLASVVTWDSVITSSSESEAQVVRLLHASLGDFLLDSSRSKHLSINAKSMHTIFALQCMQQLKCLTSDRPLYLYTYRNLPYHLSNSLPTSELRKHLLTFSLEDLVEDIDVLYCNTGDTDMLITHIDFCLEWTPKFFGAIKTLVSGDPHSHLAYALHLSSYDRLMKAELYKRTKHMDQTEVASLLALVYILPSLRLPLLGGMSRNTNVEVNRTYQTPIVREGLDMLYAFLEDPIRSEMHPMDGQTYATASLSHQFNAFAPRYTGLEDKMRRNTPWRWRKVVKMNKFFKARRQLASKRTLYRYDPEENKSVLSPHPFPQFHSKREVEMDDSMVYSLALQFLPQALNRSTKMDELIEAARAEPSFSQLSRKFPRRTKKAKKAIAKYLARVMGDESTGEGTQDS